MTANLDPATIAVGDELPTFTRKGTLHAFNRYAAVNYEFVDIHMSDESGQAAGYERAFGMGNLQWAYFHAMLRDWMGEDGRVVKMACQFRSPSLRDLVVTAHGRVTAVRREGGEVLVDLDIWTDNDRGAIQAPGTATVALPAG